MTTKKTVFQLRLTEEEKAAWEERARAAKMALATWIRMKCGSFEPEIMLDPRKTTEYDRRTEQPSTKKRFWKNRCTRCERLDIDNPECLACEGHNH